MNVYAAANYLGFIRSKMKENEEARGYQGRLAQAAGVHGSYFSRVLSGTVNLTPDQAYGLSEFWGLNADETEFFVNLVHHERAGSPGLKRAIELRLEELRQKAADLSSKFTASFVPAEQDQQIYFSAWYFAAVHMALTIPSLRDDHSIARHFGLGLPLVRHIFSVLEALGLAQKHGSKWTPGKNDLHVANHAHYAPVQHANWRIHTAAVVHERSPESFHYSGVHTLSQEDFVRLKIFFSEMVARARKRVEKSPEQEIACLCVDWYRLDRPRY